MFLTFLMLNKYILLMMIISNIGLLLVLKNLPEYGLKRYLLIPIISFLFISVMSFRVVGTQIPNNPIDRSEVEKNNQNYLNSLKGN